MQYHKWTLLKHGTTIKSKSVLGRLGLMDLSQKLNLSGGQLRAALAKVLVDEADFSFRRTYKPFGYRND